MSNPFQLQLSKKKIPEFFEKYDPGNDALPREEIAPKIIKRGYCKKEEFIQLCHWKSQRIQHHTRKNSAEFIKEVTRTAFATSSEQLRIEVLLLLKGVSWPVASALLHWGHKEAYPILDFRALWSLGVDPPPTYNFDFWKVYTTHCRELAWELDIPIREVDRALWMYSKNNQRL